MSSQKLSNERTPAVAPSAEQARETLASHLASHGATPAPAGAIDFEKTAVFAWPSGYLSDAILFQFDRALDGQDLSAISRDLGTKGIEIREA